MQRGPVGIVCSWVHRWVCLQGVECMYRRIDGWKFCGRFLRGLLATCDECGSSRELGPSFVARFRQPECNLTAALSTMASLNCTASNIPRLRRHNLKDTVLPPWAIDTKQGRSQTSRLGSQCESSCYTIGCGGSCRSSVLVKEPH
jgi:hypothetical protein